GVGVICADFFSPQVRALLAREIPCVTVDYSSEKHPCVMTNNEDAYGELVDYIYSRGHRRVAVIRDNTSTISDIRYDCLRKVCAQRGIELSEKYTFFACYNDVDSAAEATRALLKLPQLPTCIFYPDDITCVGGIDELRKNGFSVPKDISVVGFDGIQLSQIIHPSLTTYRQDMESIGRNALHLLLEDIENPEATGARQRYISGKFLPGETVANLCPCAYGSEKPSQ
ncbi:MAG: substrate-binding domain-containing protein, partial [Eubacteriales bacterium]|nr:substrate-binding domain-containing protein [Eubacteriales bacterium]